MLAVFLSFKTYNPHPTAMFTGILLIFPWSMSFKNSMLHGAPPLSMWQMKVKTGLQSNPSQLFVSFDHREHSDVVLPCWRGSRGGVGGAEEEEDFSSVPSSNESQ